MSKITDDRARAGLCPVCAQRGPFIQFQLVCSKHGPYSCDPKKNGNVRAGFPPMAVGLYPAGITDEGKAVWDELLVDYPVPSRLRKLTKYGNTEEDIEWAFYITMLKQHGELHDTEYFTPTNTDIFVLVPDAGQIQGPNQAI